MKFSEIAFKCLFAHRANFLWVNLATNFSASVVGWICRKEKFWLWRQNFTNDEASLRSVVVQMRTHFKILISRGVGWLHVRHLHGKVYVRCAFGCRLCAARADVAGVCWAGRGDRNFGIWSSWHAKFNRLASGASEWNLLCLFCMKFHKIPRWNSAMKFSYEISIAEFCWHNFNSEIP